MIAYRRMADPQDGIQLSALGQRGHERRGHGFGVRASVDRDRRLCVRFEVADHVQVDHAAHVVVAVVTDVGLAAEQP